MNKLPDKTFLENNAELLLKEAGLNKAKFSELMGIARQNVQKVFETKNVFTLMKAAEVLGISLQTIIYGTTETPTIDGFIEINGIVFRIKDKKDIEDILTRL